MATAIKIEKMKTNAQPGTFTCGTGVMNNIPAPRYTRSCTRAPANAGMVLNDTNSAGGVEVVIKTSSVPVCCDSWIAREKLWIPASKNV